MKNTENFMLELYEYDDNANLMDGFNHNMEILDAQLLANRTDINQLNTRISNLELSVTQALQQISTSIESLDALTTRVSTVETQYTSLNQQVQIVNGNLTETTTQTNTNKTNIETLTSDYNELNSRVSVLEEKGE